jgi:hypothetical protein
MDLIKTFWPIAIGFVAFLVWLIRLESKGLQNEREIKRLWNQRKEDLDAAREDRKRIHDILAEIQSDIKQLIGKVGK